MPRASTAAENGPRRSRSRAAGPEGPDGPGSRLGRPPKQRDQRLRILQTAARKIATVGYEQCSLAEIATDLELTTPALYHYFPTKQSIFTEIAMTAMKGTYDAVRNAIDSNASCAKQLESLMVAHAEHFDRNYWLVNATITGYAGIARREIERLEEFERFRNRNESVLLSLLRRGIRAGEFRKVDVKATARSIYQLLNITRWYRPGGRRTAADIARGNCELVIGGLKRDVR